MYHNMDVRTVTRMSTVKYLILTVLLLLAIDYGSARKEKPLFCPSEIPNGKLQGNCSTGVASECDFRCDDTYRPLEGVNMIVCLADGRWSVNEFFLCRKQHEVKQQPRKDFDAASVFCGLAAGFLIVCVVYILKIVIKQRLKKMKKEETFIVRYRRAETERSSNDYLENASMMPNANGNVSNSNSSKKDNSLKRDKPQKPATKDKYKDHIYKNVFKNSPYENA